jgi:hypothetical protein
MAVAPSNASLVGPAPVNGGFAVPGLRVALCRECEDIRPDSDKCSARITPPVQSGLKAPGTSPTAGDGLRARGEQTMPENSTTNRSALNRRNLLHRALAGAAGAAIALPASAAVPSSAAAISSADPLPAMVDEYFRLIDVVNNSPDPEESDLAFEQEDALVQHVVDTAATTAAGLLAQLRVLRDIVQTSGDDWTDNQNTRLLDTMGAGIERLSAGGVA